MDIYNRTEDAKYDLGSPSQYAMFTPYSDRIEQLAPYNDRAITEMLAREPKIAPGYSGTDTLSEQIFGREINHAGLSVDRLNQMLYERCSLHYLHLKDIRHRHMKCQCERFCLKLNSPDQDGRRWASIDSMLAQLETEKRREDLTWWKDTTEIRNTIWDKRWEYDKAKGRAYTLGSLLPDSLGVENA